MHVVRWVETPSLLFLLKSQNSYSQTFTHQSGDGREHSGESDQLKRKELKTLTLVVHLHCHNLKFKNPTHMLSVSTQAFRPASSFACSFSILLVSSDNLAITLQINISHSSSTVITCQHQEQKLPFSCLLS